MDFANSLEINWKETAATTRSARSLLVKRQQLKSQAINYLYILREFRKLVITFFPVKNTHKLIN